MFLAQDSMVRADLSSRLFGFSFLAYMKDKRVLCFSSRKSINPIFQRTVSWAKENCLDLQTFCALFSDISGTESREIWACSEE